MYILETFIIIMSPRKRSLFIRRPTWALHDTLSIG